MVYSIFRNNILVTKIKPDNNSVLSQKTQQEDIIRMNFTLDSFTELLIGDCIPFEKTNEFYYLNKQPRVLESPKNYKYECIFEGRLHELRKIKIFLDTPKEGGGFYRDYKFPLTGNAETFLNFIVQNLNRGGASYVVGSFKDTGTSTIDFNNWDGFEAITSIAETLNFEWYLEEGTLHFDSKPGVDVRVFQVGRKNGFISLTRARVENENVETVVYGYGSTENLPPRSAEEGMTYDSDLLTENRLSFEGEDGESKLSNNTETYGVIEVVQEFDDIKPEFTGTVSGVGVENVRVFFDDSIDFDINGQLLSGIVPKITFLTGKLIGLTFDILFEIVDNKITMDYYSDESGQYPNDIIFAEVGDQYKLFDLIMPEGYIEDAKTRLEEATQQYLNDHSAPLEFYSGEVDQEFIRTYGMILNLGDVIRVISNSFGLDELYAIKELTQNIIDPTKYTVGFGDILPKGLLATLKISNFKTDQSIYNVQKNSITNNQITNVIGEDLEWDHL